MRLQISMCLLLAACGGGNPGVPDATLADAAKPVDAPTEAAIDAMGPDLSCLGQPPPSGGSGPIAITGKVFAVDHYAVAPTTATVELRRRSDDGLVGQATSAAADGAFSIAAPGPVDGYFVVTANGKLPTRASSDTPLTADQDALLLVADAAELGRWYADAGGSFASGARTVVAAVRDCAREPATGSTASIAPAPASVVYYDDAAKRWQPALAASTNGFVLATSTAASVAITPRLGGTAFPVKQVAALPDTLTLVVISPYE
jgi:hypothetical protein